MDSTEVQFESNERASETGLDYFGARYFSAAQGRFTSPDDVFADQHASDPQSWNMYAYVRNNPLRFTDPSGNKCASGTDDESGLTCFTATAHASLLGRALSSIGSFFKSAAQESTANTVIDTYNMFAGMTQMSFGNAPPQQARFEPTTGAGQYGQWAGIIGPLFVPGVGEEAGARVLGTLGFSSRAVAAAAKELEAGATTIRVGSKSEAGELFLRLFQGEGYRNTTGWNAMEVKDFFGSKGGTYHWDTILGHGVDNPHGGLPHLQIHPEKGPTIRIFFGPND